MASPEVKFKYSTYRQLWMDPTEKYKLCPHGVREYIHTRRETHNTLVITASKRPKEGSLRFDASRFEGPKLDGRYRAMYYDVEELLIGLQRDGYKYLNFYWEDRA